MTYVGRCFGAILRHRTIITRTYDRDITSNMKREEFLKISGALGLATMIPGASHAHDHDEAPLAPPAPGGACVLIPQETAGPYPLDLSGSSTYFRTDIRETQAGADHRFRLRILGVGNCLGMLNARVDVWHCNVDGYYSGYTTSAHLGTQNNNSARFLRGIQMTDANGEVEFITKFPGWYPGRTCHIHFQVFIGSMSQCVSQFAFPSAEKNALLTSVAPYTTWGADPLDFTTDGIFSDGYTHQVSTLTFNSLTNEYESFLEVGIVGDGTTAISKPKENVITVASVMQPGALAADDLSIAADATVASALRILLGERDSANVRGADGTIVGHVTRDDVGRIFVGNA